MTRRKPKPTLPDKMSELILVALADLCKVEKLKDRFEIDMEQWHVGNDYTASNKCVVCFAGSVLAMTLGVPDDRNEDGSSFPSRINKKIDAIDRLRTGQVALAGGYLGLDHTKLSDYDRPVASYRADAAQFKRDMRKLAKDLAKGGY